MAVRATRREQRERALGLLYEAGAKAVPVGQVLDELPVPADAWVAEVAVGVEGNLERIDAVIGAHAIGWALDRMPVVDLTVLRMATWELLEQPGTPTGAVISEAVELAKQYSTDESGRFVNGVLASVAAEVRPAP